MDCKREKAETLGSLLQAERNWEEVRDENCQRCELHSGAQSVCLLGNGPVPAKYMLVGEAPGRREDELTKVFQNIAGSNLDRHLQRVGVKREDFYITNAVKCRPPKNRTPTAKEIKACQKFLLEEIRRVQPEVIITLGATALKGVIGDGKASIKKFRGRDGITVNKIKVSCTYHPMAEGYDPNVRRLVEEDFDRIFCGVKNLKSGIKRRYYLYRDWDEFYKRSFRRAGYQMSVDFETTGLQQREVGYENLVIGFCWKEGRAYSVNLNHPGGPVQEYQQWLEYIIENHSMVGQNIKYELKCLLKEFGNEILPLPHPIKDTMIAFHLLDENYPSKSLSVLKRKYTDLGDLEDAVEVHKKDMISLPLPVVAAYNCEDVDATLRINNILDPQLKEEGLYPLYEDLMEVTQMLAEVEWDGCKIDMSQLHKNIDLFDRKKKKIEAQFPGVNLNSDQQVGEILYGKLKLPVLAFTEKENQPATGADILRDLLDLKEVKPHAHIIKAILDYKKLTHFDSHFLTGLDNRCLHGYFYPNYNLAKYESDKGKDVGTVTGRLSASLIHQIPRDTDELEKLMGDDTMQIREMFISRFHDGCITRADWSQIELRLLAEYSQDDVMINDFKSGLDIHSAVTKRLMDRAKKFYGRFNDNFEAMRKATKAVNFGIIYGISPWALAERLGIGDREGKDIINSWFEVYHKAKRWLVKMENQAIRTGEVRSLVGRKRRLPGADRATATGRRVLRQATNSPIQGLASDICVIRAKEIWKEMKRNKMLSKLIIFLHDEIVIDTHPIEKEVIPKLIYKHCHVQEFPRYNYTFNVPLIIDVEQHRTWSKHGGD